MLHFLLQALCFFLEASAFNLMFLGGVMASKRATGSALLIVTGVACLLLNFGLAISAHVDIAKSLAFAGMTTMLMIPLLVRRIVSKQAHFRK
jgi:hypothetical protein